MELSNQMMYSDIDSFRIKQECPDFETGEIDIEYHDDPDDPLPDLTMQDLIATIGKRGINDCISNSPDLHVCDVCLRGYKTKHNLSAHLRYECNQKARLQCAHCSQRFKQPQNLKSHVFAVHPEKPWVPTDPSSNRVTDTSLLFPSRFHCATCFRSYADKHRLKRHLQSCSELPQLKCRKCSFRTLRPACMMRHDRNVHCLAAGMLYVGRCQRHNGRQQTCLSDVLVTEGPRDKHPCPDCPKSYQTREQLQRHADIECGKTPMQSACKMCATISEGPREERKDQNSLHTVIKMEPVENTVPIAVGFPVKIVSSVTFDESTVQCRTEPVEPATLFQCPKCHVVMKTQTSFEDHLCRETDKHKPGFQCPKCAQVLATPKARKNHLCTKRCKVQCALCLYTTTKQKLETHLRAKHPEVMESTSEKYVCHRCNKSFKSLENLKGHLRATCGKEKTIPCPHADCTYMAKSKNHMNTHLKQSRKHNGRPAAGDLEQKPWPCQVCDKSFMAKGELVKHVKYRCGQNPQFHCLKCQRIYGRKKDLNRHMTYECGKPPSFLCPYCSYSAKRKYSLKSHIALRHEPEINIKGQ